MGTTNAVFSCNSWSVAKCDCIRSRCYWCVKQAVRRGRMPQANSVHGCAGRGSQLRLYKRLCTRSLGRLLNIRVRPRVPQMLAGNRGPLCPGCSNAMTSDDSESVVSSAASYRTADSSNQNSPESFVEPSSSQSHNCTTLQASAHILSQMPQSLSRPGRSRRATPWPSAHS